MANANGRSRFFGVVKELLRRRCLGFQGKPRPRWRGNYVLLITQYHVRCWVPALGAGGRAASRWRIGLRSERGFVCEWCERIAGAAHQRSALCVAGTAAWRSTETFLLSQGS